MQPRELIVVDDGSNDGSKEVALEFGATVLSTEGRSGPARARNLGASKATSPILFFIDADVCLSEDSFERTIRSFESDPELDALMGAYDDSPAARDFLSIYRNLMHSFVHRTGRQEASTFWTGCGAVRRERFLELNGFSESYERPAIEDIEFGYRLARAGGKIVLDRDLRVKHLKRWTFWNLVRTDVLDRGIPWTELILRDGNMPDDLNLQISQRISVSLVFLTVAVASACAFYWRGYFLIPLFAILFFFLGRYWTDGFSARSKGSIATMSVSFLCLILLAWTHHMLGLIPVLGTGFAVLMLKHRYQYDRNSRPRWMTLAGGVFFSLIFLGAILYLPTHPAMFVLLGLLLALVILNNQFYLFLAQREGRLFALAAIPFHLLYHFYNGVSFGIGLVRWLVKSRRGMRTPAELLNEKR